jgi:hypothetical protein
MDVSLKEEEKKPWGYIIAGTSFYFGLMYPICQMVESFNEYQVNTESWFFNVLYYRYYVNTYVLGIPQLAYYVLALPIAYTFINVVNLNFERGSLFKDARGGYTSFKQTVLFSFLFFFISGMVVLRQKDDLQGYCGEQPANATSSFELSLANHTGNFTPNYTMAYTNMGVNVAAADQLAHPLSKLMYTIDKMRYIAGPYHPQCQEFTGA